MVFEAASPPTAPENDVTATPLQGPVIYSAESEFNGRVLIEAHPSHGNLLYLGGLRAHAEADVAFNAAMVDPISCVLSGGCGIILGGGDGGVLHRVLRFSPSTVDMVEIDEIVVEGCRAHFRDVYGDVLDERSSARHTPKGYKRVNDHVLIGDGVKFLAQQMDLDFVISDMSAEPVRDEDIPLSPFLSDLFQNAYLALRPGGRFSTVVQLSTLTSLTKKVMGELQTGFTDIIRQEVYIPSFEACWTFLSATRKGGDFLT